MSDNDKLLLSSLVAIIESLQAENAKSLSVIASLITERDELLITQSREYGDLERVTSERDALRQFAKAFAPRCHEEQVDLLLDHALWDYDEYGATYSTPLLTGTEVL